MARAESFAPPHVERDGDASARRRLAGEHLHAQLHLQHVAARLSVSRESQSDDGVGRGRTVSKGMPAYVQHTDPTPPLAASRIAMGARALRA